MSSVRDDEVSAIVPARNEEANIARVVRSLAGQSGLKEIVVVNDQSDDGTASILHSLAPEIPKLRTLTIDSLPPGWMGKTHAVATGAAAAKGSWLLFTDADTEHLEGSLAILLERACRDNIDLLSLSPGQDTLTWWEKSVIPLVFVKLSSLFRFEDVSDPKSPAAAANGQFILVRREAYEKSGGHAAVKSAILEDVELARRIKLAGGRLLFLPGPDWVRTRMYQTFGSMWQGWTKNLYLLYGGDKGRMLVTVTSLWALDVLPVVLFVALCLGFAVDRMGGNFMLVALTAFLLALVRQRNYGQALMKIGFDPALAAYQPTGAALLGLIMLQSIRAHRSAGSIKWKGRQYATRGSE